MRKYVTRVKKQVLKYVKNFYNPIDILLKVWYLIHGTDKTKGAKSHGKDSIHSG